MKLHLTLLGCLLLTACGTSYKVAPTTTKVATKIATARRTVQQAREVTTRLDATTSETKVHAATTATRIDATLAAILKQDYDSALRELTGAQKSNTEVQTLLDESRRNIASLQGSLSTTEGDLSDAQGEIEKLNRTIEVMAVQGAKDRAIVEQVNWGFGLGAFIYGIKRILTFGFFGALVLVAVGIVLLCFGGVGAAVVRAIIVWIISRKSVK